jgi:hypothetical protein
VNTLKSLVEAFIMHRLQTLNLNAVSLITSRNQRTCGDAPAAWELQALAMSWLGDLARVEPAVLELGVLVHCDAVNGLQFSIVGRDVWQQIEDQSLQDAHVERRRDATQLRLRR